MFMHDLVAASRTRYFCGRWFILPVYGLFLSSLSKYTAAPGTLLVLLPVLLASKQGSE